MIGGRVQIIHSGLYAAEEGAYSTQPLQIHRRVVQVNLVKQN